jgi:hypothetical protein
MIVIIIIIEQDEQARTGKEETVTYFKINSEVRMQLLNKTRWI